MTSDIVLSAALRSNLSSLANTQTQIDKTQLALSTGKKVNSALDNPQEFFQAQALNNSASDLTNLLDSFSNSIQTVNAANNGITSLTSFINQAQSIAQTAQTDVANGSSSALATGTTDLSGVTNLGSLSGIDAGAKINLVVTNSAGKVVNLGQYGQTSATSANVAAIGTGGNTVGINDLINSINDLQIDPSGGGTANGGAAFKASLNSSGQLQIAGLNGYNVSATFSDTTNSDASNSAVASALGFANIAALQGNGGGTNKVGFTATATSALTSNAFYTTQNGSQVVADRSSLISSLKNASGTAYFSGLDTTDGDDKLQISINGGTAQSISLEDSNDAGVSIQNVIDSINNNSALSSEVQAGFNDTTGQITLTSLSSNVQTVQIGTANATNAGISANWGFGGTATAQHVTTAADPAQNTYVLGQANGALATDQTNFNNVLDQINSLVQDTGYQGVNLLAKDDLTTYFDSNRSTSQTINGVDFSSSGLGLKNADFSSASAVSDALTQVQSALNSVRAYGSSLADNLSTIQNRQTFTNSTISTLQTGANNLVDADTNTESANLLALQTQQSLGVDALSLASQSAQSVLKLFG